MYILYIYIYIYVDMYIYIYTVYTYTHTYRLIYNQYPTHKPCLMTMFVNSLLRQFPIRPPQRITGTVGESPGASRLWIWSTEKTGCVYKHRVLVIYVYIYRIMVISIVGYIPNISNNFYDLSFTIDNQ